MLDSPIYCPAPDYQLQLRPNGDVGVCCYHFGIKLGNVNTHTLLEMWNGRKLKKLRDEFKTQSIKTCRSRTKHQRCHQRISPLNSGESLNNERPKKLEVRLNGTCNLQCVMCDVWQQPRGVYTEANFWNEARKEIFPFLNEVEILGGEPFVQTDTFKIIAEIQKVNERCFFSFVTNGHYPWTQRLAHTFESIRLRRLHISLDSLDSKTYSSIRRSGNLDLVMETLPKLVSAAKTQNADLAFSMCVLQSNYHEIPQFLLFCKEHEATAILQYAFHDPSKQESLKYLSRNQREDIAEQILSKTEHAEIEGVHEIISALREFD